MAKRCKCEIKCVRALAVSPSRVKRFGPKGWEWEEQLTIIFCPMHDAAPRMFEALEAALDAWHDDDSNFDRELRDGTPEWLAKLRAALAAAKGE